MKFDFKKIQKIVSEVPDIVSKGQQIFSTVHTVTAPFRAKEATDESVLLSVSTEVDLEPSVQEENGIQDYESKEADHLELAIAGVGYLKAPGDVMAMIGEMAQQANETIRFCEEQKIIRTEIRAKSAVEITKINMMADMIRDYLERSFDERSGLFDNYFYVLDKALENGNNTLVAQTLQSINSLAASSPFKDLTNLNKISTMLAEGGEWDI